MTSLTQHAGIDLTVTTATDWSTTLSRPRHTDMLNSPHAAWAIFDAICCTRTGAGRPRGASIAGAPGFGNSAAETAMSLLPAGQDCHQASQLQAVGPECAWAVKLVLCQRCYHVSNDMHPDMSLKALVDETVFRFIVDGSLITLVSQWDSHPPIRHEVGCKHTYTTTMYMVDLGCITTCGVWQLCIRFAVP
jgi:hypothetical protein